MIAELDFPSFGMSKESLPDILSKAQGGHAWETENQKVNLLLGKL